MKRRKNGESEIYERRMENRRRMVFYSKDTVLFKVDSSSWEVKRSEERWQEGRSLIYEIQMNNQRDDGQTTYTTKIYVKESEEWHFGKERREGEEREMRTVLVTDYDGIDPWGNTVVRERINREKTCDDDRKQW